MRRSHYLAELVAPFRRMVFNPQNVKNIVTFMPMAAAPVAMMKAAMARSRSPLKSTIVTRSGFAALRSARATAGSIWVVVMGASQDSCTTGPGFQRFLTIVSASFSCQHNDLDQVFYGRYSPDGPVSLL